MVLSAKLKQRRLERGWSAAELCRRTGLSSGYLAKLEAGTIVNPSADVLDRLARALETSVTDLLDRPAYSEPPATPSALRQFAEEAGLDQQTVDMLARISYRGRQPSTTRDWAFLLEAIKRAIAGGLD